MNTTNGAWTRREYVMTAGVMTLMGGFYWAIRGTGGYGGETGGMLAGFGWALLWYAFSRRGAGAERRPYGGPWMLVAITFGIALGGMTGYGVYISWVKGNYCLNYPELCRPVSVWTGYGMLFLCGLHWGGNAGCFMAWCAPQRPLLWQDWFVRIGCGVVGAVSAAYFVRAFPQLFLPFYAEGVYGVLEYKTCVRAMDSLHTIAPHVGLFLGFLLYEAARRDKRAVAMILTMALGFAIPFSAGGYWQTFTDSSLKLSWWKHWEMTIGLGGGLAFGLAFWWFNRPGERTRSPLGRWSGILFRSGIPLWLPTVMVFDGLYGGRCQMAHLEPSLAGKLVVLFAAMACVAMVLWRDKVRMNLDRSEGFSLSYQSIMAFQIIIIGAGWAVTVPGEWHLANRVLAALYVFYLCLSALLLWRLRRVEPASD